MLGDFNLHDVNWAAPNINCHNVDKLTDLADHLFINQQVEHPTRKSNILDLIFSPDEFITCRSIHITETFISEHSILLTRGVPRIWEGGQEFFFFRFGKLHVAKRHATHGETMRIASGVRGHAPPRKIF